MKIYYLFLSPFEERLGLRLDVIVIYSFMDRTKTKSFKSETV